MKKVTLVFYEYPAAKHMIDEWEKQMGSEITNSHDRMLSAQPNRYFSFNLENKNEIVFVWPIDLFSITDVMNVVTQHGQYYKTLIFGKVDLNQLEKIQKAIIYVQ